MQKTAPADQNECLHSDFLIDNIYLRATLTRIREANPDKFPSLNNLADACRVSESTLKKLIAGDNPNPRCNTLFQLCDTFREIDIRRIMRLPVSVHIERDETMVELRHQVTRLEDQLERQTQEASELQRALREAHAEKTRAMSEAEALAKSVDKLDKQLRRHRWTMFAIVMAVLAIFTYIAAAIANPQRGMFDIFFEAVQSAKK